VVDGQHSTTTSTRYQPRLLSTRQCSWACPHYKARHATKGQFPRSDAILSGGASDVHPCYRRIWAISLPVSRKLLGFAVSGVRSARSGLRPRLHGRRQGHLSRCSGSDGFLAAACSACSGRPRRTFGGSAPAGAEVRCPDHYTDYLSPMTVRAGPDPTPDPMMCPRPPGGRARPSSVVAKPLARSGDEARGCAIGESVRHRTHGQLQLSLLPSGAARRQMIREGRLAASILPESLPGRLDG